MKTLFLSLFLTVGSIYPDYSDDERASYVESLEREMLKSKETLSQQIVELTRGDSSFSMAQRQRLETAQMVYNVKVTLLKNLRNASSLKSPVVRRQLLTVFQQTAISEKDLEELQKTVDRERKRL